MTLDLQLTPEQLSPEFSQPGLPRLNSGEPNGACHGDSRFSTGAPETTPVPAVEILPAGCVKRSAMVSRGLAAELVQSARLNRFEARFRADRHLLVAYEQAARSDGESFVDGLPRSARRDLSRRFLFVPAGHEYREWHEPRGPVRVMYFYFDPGEVGAPAGLGLAPAVLRPRLFFEDRRLRETVLKIESLLESPAPENRLYFEALSIVLFHEAVRAICGHAQPEPRMRGGLAAWQQRVVTAYIDEHLSEPIALSTLAELARLSPYHFCRAFKQSFGIPPHRYHMRRRIERAKALLQDRPLISVTEVGLALGFSETSSFTAAFRRTTGLTPSRYHRTMT
jgi:AraC family transcriptional regulator